MIDPVSKSEIARNAAKLWHGDVESLRNVGNSANHVYTFVESGARRYLRMTSSRNRSKEQVEAELDFISYLRRGGVRAVAAITSAAGRLVEEMSLDDERLFICAFEEATGAEFRYDSAKPNKGHFALRGRTLGQIHALSRCYLPSTVESRPAWDEDELLLQAGEFLPKSETDVWHAYHRLREWLQVYPKSQHTYGLIHGDFGATNYRCEDRQLVVFDFDDCSYHWFLYDLAISIYPHGWRKEGLRLFDWLLEGYCEYMKLDVTLKDVTMFCQWRLVYMFLVYARKWGFENLSKQQADWLSQKRENIARGYQWLG